MEPSKIRVELGIPEDTQETTTKGRQNQGMLHLSSAQNLDLPRLSILKRLGQLLLELPLRPK